MDGNAADLEGLFQPHVFPGFAAVAGFVDAIAPGDGVARIVLAGADPDDIRITRSDGDTAEGDGRLEIEEVSEAVAVVDGLEQAAGCGGDEKGAGIGFDDGKID